MHLYTHWSTLSHKWRLNCEGCWMWWAAAFKSRVTRHRETIPVPLQTQYLQNYERPLKKIKESSLKLAIWKSLKKHLLWSFILAHLAIGRIQIVRPNFGWLHDVNPMIWEVKKKNLFSSPPLIHRGCFKTPQWMPEATNSSKLYIYYVSSPHTHIPVTEFNL